MSNKHGNSSEDGTKKKKRSPRQNYSQNYLAGEYLLYNSE